MAKCKDCLCDCHCSVSEHSDANGVCACEKCNCNPQGATVNNDECETCQQIQKNAVACTQKKKKTTENVASKKKKKKRNRTPMNKASW